MGQATLPHTQLYSAHTTPRNYAAVRRPCVVTESTDPHDTRLLHDDESHYWYSHTPDYSHTTGVIPVLAHFSLRTFTRIQCNTVKKNRRRLTAMIIYSKGAPSIYIANKQTALLVFI